MATRSRTTRGATIAARRRPAGCLLALMLMATSHAGLASAETATDEARRHFALGVELAEKNALAEAAQEFQRAYDVSPHFSVLYNLGQAYVGLDRPIEAADTLAKYLADGGAGVPADRRAEVEGEIARESGRIATITLDIGVAGAAALVDGREVGKSPLAAPVRVVAGPHTFSASLAGYTTDQRTLQVAGGDVGTVVLRPMPAAEPTLSEPAPPIAVAFQPPWADPRGRAPAPVEGPQPSGDASPAGTVQRTIGYVTGGLGVVGLGVGTGFALVMSSKGRSRNAVAAACQDHCSDGDIERATAFQHDAETAATRANVAFIAGGVLAAAGVVLVLSAPTSGGGSTAVRATPWLGDGSIGLGTSGTF